MIRFRVPSVISPIPRRTFARTFSSETLRQILASKPPRMTSPGPKSAQFYQEQHDKKQRLLKDPQTAKNAAPVTTWKPLVWIDCEMTGLDVKNDNIIEICCLITDGDLNIVDEAGFESTVYVPQAKLDSMNEWCVQHHGQSGLTAKVLANPHRTLDVVQQELLHYIHYYVAKPRQGMLAGNSVHMDKFFMMKEFPQVIDFLHYRVVDVSSFIEMGWRHNPDLMKKSPRKKECHTARADIEESIQQLKWFRQHYLKNSKETEAVEDRSKHHYE